MAFSGFFGAGRAKILGGAPSRVGTNAQGRTNSIFSFNRRCNCTTIASYCCVDESERLTMLKSIFNPGLLPFALAGQQSQTWRVAYYL